MALDYGVTPEGYVVKTQAEINAEAQTALLAVTDPVTGESLQANLSDPSDPVSQIVGITLEGVSNGVLVDQAAYNQFDPGKATGDALSSLVLINGLWRKVAGQSSVFLNFTGTPSTSGTMTTGVVAAIGSFTAVDDGSFSITIDGVTENITSLDFTAAVDYDDVAGIIQTAIQAVAAGGYTDATVSASAPSGASVTFTFTSGSYGTSSTVSLLAAASPATGTDISDSSYLNGTAGTIVNGTGVVIPIGIVVTDSNRSNLWSTTTPFTFDLDGVANNINALCNTRGAVSANPGTLTQLVSPSGVINTVSNLYSAVVANNEETDNTLRHRRDNSTEAPSIGLIGSLSAALQALANISFVRIYNNTALTTDSNGLPGKSVGCVVVGGDDTEIAQTIFQRLSIGPSTSGNTSVTFEDNFGGTYTINFYRPAPISIDIQVNITIVQADVFPTDGVAQIQNAIVAYAVGGASALGITQGFDQEGFPPGQNVLLSRLYTPINSVPGHEVTSILMKKTTDPDLEPADVVIAFNEVADIEVANIDVVVS